MEAALKEDNIPFTKEEGERGTKIAFTRPSGYTINLADGGKETVLFDGDFWRGREAPRCQSKGEDQVTINVRIKLLTKTACVPTYMTDGASGADVQADIDILSDDIDDERYTRLRALGVDGHNRLIIPAFSRSFVPLGFAVAVPKGYEMQIRSRSGLANKHGIHVLNSPGTIDSDYRGEVGVILANSTTGPFVVKHGDRIAQAVIARAPEVKYNITDDLFATERGTGGLGSTGV